MKKNDFLELMRFLFCIVVVLHHGGFVAVQFPFKNSGMYAVEFFFMLTGALTMKHVVDNRSKISLDSSMSYSVQYVMKKMLRIFPFAFVGTLLGFILYENRQYDFNIIREFLFLQQTWITDFQIEFLYNAPLWYLSVILFLLPIVMYLMLRFKDVFNSYLSWALPLLLFGFMMKNYLSTISWGHYNGWIDTAFIRGMADLSLGGFVYLCSQRISRLEYPNKSIFTLVEIVFYSFSFYLMYRGIKPTNGAFFTLMLCIPMSISLSNRSYLNRENSIMNHLGKLSLPIYCVHWSMYSLTSQYFGNLNTYIKFALAIFLSVALSEILIALVSWIKKNPPTPFFRRF